MDQQHTATDGVLDQLAELEAEFGSKAFLTSPPPAVRPVRTPQPRPKQARSLQPGDDEYYFDTNDGMIKPEPETLSQQPPVRAAERDWD